MACLPYYVSPLLTFLATVIAESDLQTVTKKKLREQLEARYQASIAEKKAFINQQIDACLADV